MLVIIANHLPPAVRGLLKVWCLEPKPNVFVTDLDSRSESHIHKFLRPYFKTSTGLLVISSDKKSLQGFTIAQEAKPERRMVIKSGLQLIEEKPPSAVTKV
jgi:CRISPR-associated protein Cas2